MQRLSTKSATAPQPNGFGALRKVLESACTKTKCDLSDLTVLSAKSDPYRLDTVAGHRDGAWLAEEMNRLLGTTAQIHWRGLHYVFVTRKVRKPDGTIYANNDDDWIFLSEVAGKKARWLGYIPFERITDSRNKDAVTVFRKASLTAESYVNIGLDVVIPDVDDLEPRAFVTDFEGRQAYQFVIFGEKASLEDVVLPIARSHQADLYLVAGEISDTLMYRIAKDAVADGRPLVVFTLTDCDPAGYQMSVSIGRKLQALRDLLFPKLRFELVPVALTVEQVRELGLPSTPLKETEKRADRWREASGVEQTEIDAIATLNPRALRNIIEAAFTPYFDASLDDRVSEAKATWLEEAQSAIDEQTDQRRREALREEAAARLTEMQETLDDLNARMRLATGDFDLPPIEIPEPDIEDSDGRQALLRFDDDWLTATRALKNRKSYNGGE